jgi:DNA-binding NarL/FixJ family response regulator
VAESKIGRTAEATAPARAYHKLVTRVFIVEPQREARAALRLLLLDLDMQVVGEAGEWAAALALAPGLQPDMLLVDSELILNGSGYSLAQLRDACPATVVIVLISNLDARQQAAVSLGADSFISKGESPDRVAERLRDAAATVGSPQPPPIFRS